MSNERSKGEQDVNARTPELTTELSGKDLEDVVGGLVYTQQKRVDGTGGGNVGGKWARTTGASA
jgi:hypothetical protein